MGILDVFKLLGGVAFFLFGMHIMSASLEKMSGGKLDRTLQKATSSLPKSFMLGIGITIAIQSSSAMTVMLVGFVNSGIMTLRQTIGVIMGSNVGTTLTAWILALAGIEGDSLLITMLKPESFSPLFAAVGAALIMFSKKQKRRTTGEILIGFAILMFGMVSMKDSVAGLEESEAFRNILIAFENPLLGVLVGTVFTGIIQSSAASVGLLQTFAMTLGIKYSVAIPIIMGQNIGTCVTALLSSIGVNRNAKRVAIAHIYFNIIGTLLYLVVLYGLDAIIDFAFMDTYISPIGIAGVHSIFNITVTAVLLPFTRQLEKLAIRTIPDKADSSPAKTFLDERLLNTPSFAISSCRDMLIKMGDIARETAITSFNIVKNYTERAAEFAIEGEAQLDLYEDKLGTYLVNLSARELADKDSWEVSGMLREIGDLERMGDHALSLVHSAREVYEKGIVFTAGAKSDLDVITAALTDIVKLTTNVLENHDIELARQVEPLEQVIDELVRKARDRHIDRMQRGECGIAPGFVWTDLMIDFGRISDHCSNIAISVMQSRTSSRDGHDFIAQIRNVDNPEFIYAYKVYSDQYKIED